MRSATWFVLVGLILGLASLVGAQPTLAAVVPVAKNDSYSTLYEQLLSVDAPGVLSNDQNTNGFALFVQSQPANGTLDAFGTDGSFTYEPNDGFSGNDSFTYCLGLISNAGPSCLSTATVTIDVLPLVRDDSYTDAHPGAELTVAAPGVLANDPGAARGNFASLQDEPTNGTVTLNRDGSFTYQPEDGFAGDDTFTYCLHNADICLPGGTATVTISVAAPTAEPDAYTSSPTGLTVTAPGVLTNDDYDTANDGVRPQAPDPQHGTVSLATNGSFVYTPDAGFVGTDTFGYCIEFENECQYGDSAASTVTITVQAGRPVAVDDSYSSPAAGLEKAAPGVLSNDKNVGTFTAVLRSSTAHGTLTLTASGGFSYTPDSGFSGADTFTYCIGIRGRCVSNVATVTLTVAAAPPTSTPPSSPPTSPSSPPSSPPTSPTVPVVPPVSPSSSPTSSSSSTPPPSTPPPSTPPSSSSAGPPTKSLDLARTSVIVGTPNVATGEDCPAGATVTLEIEGKQVAQTTADSTGHFSAPFTVPDLQIGDHTVTANCGRVQDASFTLVQSSQVDPGTTTMLVLILFVLLGISLLRGPLNNRVVRRRHG